MHIVFFTHQFFPRHVGGVEVYTLGLAKRVLARGNSATVITYEESASGNPANWGPVFTSYADVPVIEIHYNLGSAPNPARYEYDNRFVANILRHILPRLNPDLVHVMHAMKLSAAVLDVCTELEIPYIVTLCDFWFICPRHTLLKWDGSLCRGPEHVLACTKCVHEQHGFTKYPHWLRDLSAISKRNRHVRRSLLMARRIFALSRFQEAMYARNGIPPERIELLPHGLEWPDVNVQTHVPKGPINITYIGSLVEHKGVHVLLGALALLPRASLECRIYGALAPATPYIGRLRQIAGDDPRIRFMGVFEPEQLAQVLAATDILALPSLWYENDPLVVKAALHSGIPTLASDIGSLAEMIVPGRHGWLIKPADVSAWAEAIEKALLLLPHFQMEPAKVKTMDQNADEIMNIYAAEVR